MALEKQVSIDKIEIIENGILQIRQITRIVEDGNELSASYHRWTLSPGDDVSDQDDRVKDVAKVVWTKDVVKAYKEQQEAIAAYKALIEASTSKGAK